MSFADEAEWLLNYSIIIMGPEKRYLRFFFRNDSNASDSSYYSRNQIEILLWSYCEFLSEHTSLLVIAVMHWQDTWISFWRLLQSKMLIFSAICLKHYGGGLLLHDIQLIYQ